MTFKNLKLSILFSGLFTLVSISVSGQYLRKNMITATANVGFRQQKVNIGYQYSFARFTAHENSTRKNNLFLGVEAGATNLRYSLALEIFDPEFYMQARGNHLGFLVTDCIIKPKKRKKDKYKYNAVSLRYSINKFKTVNSYFNNYDKGGNLFDSDSVYDARCNSFDFELIFSKLIVLNSNISVQIGCYFGLRSGQTSGIRYNQGKLDLNTSRFNKPLKPFIFGVNVGYQLNLGKQNTK